MDKVFEELLEFIWSQRECGVHSVERLLEIEEVKREGGGLAALRELENMGLVTIEGDAIHLTSRGEKVAEQVIRRHRLAERLLHDILDIGKDEIEEHACDFEHSLSDAVTDSICTLLGHPPACPHGLPIPRGECCRKPLSTIKPLVKRLSQLEAGRRARIVFIASGSFARFEKLGSMGLMPGSVLRLVQKSPAFVIETHETTLALDGSIAEEIFIREES